MEKGTIFKFHNDLDTDQIIASQYLFRSRRREFWLWILKRAGTGCAQSTWSTGCHCEIICKNLL